MSELYIWRILFALVVMAVLARKFLRRKGAATVDLTPELDEPPIVAKGFHAATCTLPNTRYHTACTHSWWSHWWNGTQYCSDARRNCELHGGVFTIDN